VTSPKEKYPVSKNEQLVSQPLEDFHRSTTQPSPLKANNITIKAVAEILLVSEKTVLRRIQKGEIKAFKEGGKYLIDKSEFEKYLRNKELTNKPKTKENE
jgi:excisionase family DNA binding protein